MQIVEVTSEKDRKDFLLLPVSHYKTDPNWIRPLDNDIEQVFDRSKNKFYRHGDCIRFLLKNVNGVVIGRIAAFYNERTSRKESQPTGGIGFFESPNDQNAANMLFDAGKQWLATKNIEAMDGPINFGERDSWWGLIVDGFDPVPYKMNYNHPYYKQLFESYGFKTYFEQWCFSASVHNQLQGKFHARHKIISEDPDYRSMHFKKSELEKFAEDFRTVYNKAWAKHGGGKELEPKQTLQLFNSMKPVIDEKLIWFIYYKNEPVGAWINLPDINQIFKKFNGKFGLFQKLRFILELRRRKIKKMYGLVFGIVPEHQAKGVDAYMILEGANSFMKENIYHDFEMQWIGDFNPKMVSVAQNLDSHRSRTLVTYRYLFDRTKEFKRHPMI